MPTATIHIKDEVNIRISGLMPNITDALILKFSFYVPGHRYMPKFKLGWWDGKINLFSETGTTFLYFIDDIVPLLEQYDYEIEVVDHRQDYSHITDEIELIDNTYYSHFTNRKTGDPIVLWDHQVESVNRAITAGVGILEMATGSGKALSASILSRIYMEYGRVIVIVPDTDLILQTQAEFKSVGLDTGIWYGGVKDRKDVTIATWQSLDGFRELFEGVICVIVDEAHTAKANVLNEMLTTAGANVPFRFGLTGTIPPDPLFRHQIRACLGDILFSIKSWELQEKGVLASATIYQIRLDDLNNDSFNCNYANTLTKESWKDYLDYLLKTRTTRLRCIANSIIDMSETGNTFVLVPYRETGKMLQALIPDSTSLDGRDKNRLQQYDDFDSSTNAVLICTLKIAERGIDITRMYNLVLIEPGKQFARILQAFGRGLRKGKGKTHINLFDFASNDGLSLKHAKERATLFGKAKQQLEIIELGYDE